MDSPQAFVNCITSSEIFRIPASFVMKMKRALPKRVILRDRYTNMWEVEVATDGGYSCYFIEGWTQFYEDNSLELKDFMILDYDGRNLFDFRIFGRNSLEKKGVGSLKLNEHNTINQDYDDASMDDDHGDDDDDIHGDDVDDDDDIHDD
ncbi:PREDICTED: B3 domain-containing protein At5g60142-like, partial [Erythranthe guttata]|uniref:B3 domain-containing protein At5g60142-like n=1 Tax=Erythranthe guttata TaxID=4155 RepID=UPI00064D72DF